MTAQSYVVDRYVLDTLMADLVGHDHRPSSFLVYMAILAAHADGRASFSHAELAERTGQSRRTVQSAVENLKRRGLIDVSRQGPTEAATYVPLSPWRKPRPSTGSG
ncbi:helix-turn-helix domain-containing protein [uncultured Caulobacter sp.]|jgi:DNA-binding MarR family transcriptional regulator|uniref:helix-turn-helix domain-containing protein n=1 Tax=uncultured Caulobacter sp. TaxID=158749 RepID=UPI00261DEEEA|nr:helix-turn-helix domain-containing protein [uncultured Caulobacter sp.]